jgi:hypothetical protein
MCVLQADGHCLYRSIEDQLEHLNATTSPVPGVDALRSMAAAHMRAHPDEFLAFIFDKDAAGDAEAQLEEYCAELEGSAEWGGQVELVALSKVCVWVWVCVWGAGRGAECEQCLPSLSLCGCGVGMCVEERSWEPH